MNGTTLLIAAGIGYLCGAVWTAVTTWQGTAEAWPDVVRWWHVARSVAVTVLFAAAWPLVLAMAYLMARSPRTRDLVTRAVQNYRQRHVAERCRPDGCDCPCGYCRHDSRHVSGG